MKILKENERWFNDLPYDTIFIYEGRKYQKTPLMFEGCCSPKFNALEINNPEGFLYLTNYTKVEVEGEKFYE